MPSVSKLNEVKQVQDDVIVSDERQTKMLNKKRLKDVDMNSRGLSSPRFFDYTIRASVKTRNGNPHRTSASLQTPFLCLANYSTGSRTRGYSPFGLPVFQTVVSIEH